jgi:hypothetical protein
MPGPWFCTQCKQQKWSLNDLCQSWGDPPPAFATIRCRACAQAQANPTAVTACGFVYLLKSGPYYKIGKTRDFGRRFDEIRLQLPFPVEEIHKIETEDPDGIEAYWHRRFAEKRKNGEWFELSDTDIATFTWRERM